MKAIELKPTDLMAVVVPLGTESIYQQSTHTIRYYVDGKLTLYSIGKPIEYLGCITKDHIDFDVEANEYLTEYFKENYFPYGFTKCNEDCFRSLLSSNGLYFVNNYGNEPDREDYGGTPEAEDAFEEHYAEWQQAESNIVQKLLIIKPLK